RVPNVAGLVFTRATHRQQEISVRLALGASAAAVAAQTFVEALLLSLFGAALGLLVVVWATSVLRSVGAGLPRIDEITIDGSILLYTLGSAVVVGLLCGTLPAIRSTRNRASLSLSHSERTQVSRRNAVQWLLVGGQVALSVVLLVSAGLLVRSFQQLFRVDPGFDVERVLSFQVSGNWGETANYERLLARIDHTIQALTSLPGVEGAATAGFLPGVP